MQTRTDPSRGPTSSAAESSGYDELVAACRLVHATLPLDAAFSHATAARLLRLPLPRDLEAQDAPLHVSVPRLTPAIRRISVAGHRDLELRRVMTCRGMRVTSPVDTWLDLAPLVGVAALVALGDTIVHRDAGAQRDIERLVGGSRGIRGVIRAREALTLIDGASASPRESLLRLIFGRHRLPAPELNADIHDTAGGWVACCDFVWRAAWLIVEYDGEVHGDVLRRRRDAQRRRQLTALGWTVITLTADDIPAREDEAVADIRAVLDRAGLA